MQVYITNLGKYNEGEFVGAWFTPPVDYDDMTDVAYYFIDECQSLGEIPDRICNYIDYEAYGRDLDFEGRFVVTNHGVFECPY